MFESLKTQFVDFLKENASRNDAEFYLPYAMNAVIRSGTAKVRVLPTTEKWFGVTYREDRTMVMESLKKLVDQGIYPPALWN